MVYFTKWDRLQGKTRKAGLEYITWLHPWNLAYTWDRLQGKARKAGLIYNRIAWTWLHEQYMTMKPCMTMHVAAPIDTSKLLRFEDHGIAIFAAVQTEAANRAGLYDHRV